MAVFSEQQGHTDSRDATSSQSYVGPTLDGLPVEVPVDGNAPLDIPDANRDQQAGAPQPTTPLSESSPTSGLSPLATENLPAVGDRIHHYEIIRELGRGGMGVVYLARDTKLARRVAIKFLLSDPPQLTERFHFEARATARCSHENIVVIHDVERYRGNTFMVLEYLEGQTLRRLIGNQAVPFHRVVELITPVVRALVCAHEHDIVHRDLKPDNIFVTESGTVKVLDFGVAKLLESVTADILDGKGLGTEFLRAKRFEYTNPGMLLGTLPYMSPEQWGADTVDHRTDIWAVGVIMYEMVTGQHPLAPRKNRELAVIGDLSLPMPRVRDNGVKIPDELAQIIDHCLMKPKAQRMDSARALLDGLEALLPGREGRKLGASESPYPGLLSFQEGDANRFFGRSRDIANLLARLRTHPLVGLVGPTGVGKSSFLHAGVIPELKNAGENWEAFVVRPGRDPLSALSAMLLPLASTYAPSPADSVSEQRSLVRRLQKEPGYLGTLLRSRAQFNKGKILLVVDPFEELFTLTSDVRQRRAFIACLAGVADDAGAPVRVIVSMRSDFLDRVAESRHFMTELTKGLMFLPSPDRQGLEEALVLPAEMAGYRFESQGMIDNILDAMAVTPGSLPLLQFAASRLWEMRDIDRRLLTETSYAAIGGIVGALATHADAVVSTASCLSTQAPALIQAIFQRLVTPERTRAIATVAELRELSNDLDEIQRVINYLVDARLLVVQTGDNREGATVEIVHDSLIHSWPRLRRWLDDSEEDAAFLEQLRTVAKRWDAKNRPPGLLWRGEAMAEARRWRQRYRGPLSELQRAYLDATFTFADRAARTKRFLVVATMGFLVILVAAAAVALVWIRRAEQNAKDQATAAYDAKLQMEQQLELLQKTQRDKQRAESKVEQSQADVERVNAELRAALTEAQGAKRHAESESARARQALAAAQRAKGRAESESVKAHRAAEAAQRASESERRARTKLELLLKQTRERAERLESKLGPLGSDELK